SQQPKGLLSELYSSSSKSIAAFNILSNLVKSREHLRLDYYQPLILNIVKNRNLGHVHKLIDSSKGDTELYFLLIYIFIRSLSRLKLFYLLEKSYFVYQNVITQ